MNPFAAIPPSTLLMLETVASLFLISKALVLIQWRAAEHGRFSSWLDAAWFLAPWPGMNPAAFLGRGYPIPAWVGQGLLSIASGFSLICAAHLLSGLGADKRAIALLVMPGLCLVLHFGIFTLVAAFYRNLGYAVSRPFANPFRARSLNEFWGRAWNRPFVELTIRLVVRPLSTLDFAGRNTTAWAAFLTSGILHEMAITLPAGGGYGGPTLYFLIQAIGWTLEGRHTAMPVPGWVRRVWLWTWLLLPLPLLFPSPFIFEVMFPLAGFHP